MPAPLAGAPDWQKKLASIDEFARLLAVSKSAIVRWADEELLPEPLDWLALGRVWWGPYALDVRDALSGMVERPPRDGSVDRGRGRRYAEALRELLRLAQEAPVVADFGVDDPIESRRLGVKVSQQRLFEFAANRFRELDAAQNGNPSTGTSSSSDTR